MNNIEFNPVAKLLWNGGKVEKWLRKQGTTYPWIFEILPTGFCNATCPTCFFSHNRGSDIIDKDLLLGILNQLAECGVTAVNWSGGGEPTLHPNLNDFVCRAEYLGIKSGLYTNAYLEIKNPEKFSWIRITYTDKGLGAIKIPNTNNVGLCINHSESQTIKELREICEEASKLNFRYIQIRPALTVSFTEQIHSNITSPFSLLSIPKVIVTDYKYENLGKSFNYPICYGFHFCGTIDWNGKLITCPYMGYDERFIFGDLKEKSFKDIWKSIPEGIKVLNTCQQCCKNHEINKVLYSAKNVKNVEFM